jgi:hypothetical protein
MVSVGILFRPAQYPQNLNKSSRCPQKSQQHGQQRRGVQPAVQVPTAGTAYERAGGQNKT